MDAEERDAPGPDAPGAGPIERRLDDLDATFARLRALDAARVARAVRSSAGLGEQAVVDLVAALLDRLALQADRAERSARALEALGRDAAGDGPEG
jgi:hypothetical protein